MRAKTSEFDERLFWNSVSLFYRGLDYPQSLVKSPGISLRGNSSPSWRRYGFWVVPLYLTDRGVGSLVNTLGETKIGDLGHRKGGYGTVTVVHPCYSIQCSSNESQTLWVCLSKDDVKTLSPSPVPTVWVDSQDRYPRGWEEFRSHG